MDPKREGGEGGGAEMKPYLSNSTISNFRKLQLILMAWQTKIRMYGECDVVKNLPWERLAYVLSPNETLIFHLTPSPSRPAGPIHTLMIPYPVPIDQHIDNPLPTLH